MFGIILCFAQCQFIKSKTLSKFQDRNTNLLKENEDLRQRIEILEKQCTELQSDKINDTGNFSLKRCFVFPKALEGNFSPKA